MDIKTVTVLGASGYVGGRLVPALLESGYQVRAVGRSVEKLQDKQWSGHPRVEIVQADIFDGPSLKKALEGADAAYYLIHSMGPKNSDFENDDRVAAGNMVEAAGEAGIKKIIYLGGLGDDGTDLSKHLRARHEVSAILHSVKFPVTVLRAAMIIGAGSVSFEILRHLVRRLPVMITPRWVRTPSQPIAVKNVIVYLTGCLKIRETEGKTFDIGGDEILSYADLMRVYAEVAGLKQRWIIPVPVLTPYLSSLWIHLVTPIPAYIARPLTEGLKNPVICRDNRIQELIPQELLDAHKAIREALV